MIRFSKDTKVWQKMKKNLKASKSQVNIGWFQGQAYGPENNFLPLAQVAKWVEEGHINGGAFSGTHTPARPAIRTRFAPAFKESGDLLSMSIPLVHQVAMGTMSWKTLHEKIAPKILYKFKLALQMYSYPPNTSATISMKGFNDPWRETGTLIENARFKVEAYKRVSYKGAVLL